MALKKAALGAAAVLWLVPAAAAVEDTRKAADLYADALAYDLAGASDKAYATFLRAARMGMPDAQFNVAVMLDSGRGIATNPREAFIWYARAAAHGNARAIYNLALLYEAGDGVEQNEELARSLFSLSRLPAARSHLSRPSAKITSVAIGAPLPLFPVDGASHDGDTDLELIWSVAPQSEPVITFLELVALRDAHSVISEFVVGRSYFAVARGLAKGEYAWRVINVSTDKARYVESKWKMFQVL